MFSGFRHINDRETQPAQARLTAVAQLEGRDVYADCQRHDLVQQLRGIRASHRHENHFACGQRIARRQATSLAGLWSSSLASFSNSCLLSVSSALAAISLCQFLFSLGATTCFVKARTGSYPCRHGNSCVVGASMPSTLFKDMSSNLRLRRSERGFLGDRAERRARKPTSRLRFKCHHPVVDASSPT
jgi:hypothetical protein